MQQERKPTLVYPVASQPTQGSGESAPAGGMAWDADREGARWDKILTAARKKWDTERKRREQNIKTFKDGAYPQDADGKSSGVSVNQIFLYAKSTMAMLYGSDPVIQVDPRRSLGERPFADAIESWLQFSHSEALTEEADGAAVFYALMSGIAWSKEGYDPEGKMDVADALSPLEVAVDPAAKYTMAQARYMIHKTTQPVDEARQFFGRRDIEPNYTLGETEGLEKDRLLDKEVQGDKDLYQYFEIWERATGGKRNLLYRDPKRGQWLDVRDWPFVLSRTDFPFSPLMFNTQYEGIDGFSELDVVAGLRGMIQDLFEFDRRHTWRAAAKKILVDGGVWSEELLERAMSPKDLEPIRLQVPAGRALTDTYSVLSLNAPTDIEADKLNRAKNAHDELLGFGELQRGVAVRQKTATESEIEDEWSKGRIGGSIRCVDKWKRQQLRHRAQIARQLVSPDDVAEACGPEAAQAWAQFAGDSQDLVRSYTITIKAGSTGEHAKRKNVEEAQGNLELFSGVNAQLMQMGQPPRFDVVELGLEVARSKDVRNPERYLMDEPAPPQEQAGLEQLGAQAEAPQEQAPPQQQELPQPPMPPAPPAMPQALPPEVAQFAGVPV